METPHAETVVDKAVNFVKDVFGIQHDAAPEVEARPEYTDIAPEFTAENATRLDPNTLVVNPAGEVTPSNYVKPLGDPEDERIRRVIDEQPREKSALELNAESARREEGGGI